MRISQFDLSSWGLVVKCVASYKVPLSYQQCGPAQLTPDRYGIFSPKFKLIITMVVVESGVCDEQEQGSLFHQCLKSKLYQAIHPFLILLKVSGLFYTRKDRKQDKRCCAGIPFTASQVFTTLIITLHWANFLRYISAIRGNESFSSYSFLRVVYALAGATSAANATCLYVGCFRADLIPQLFVSLSSVKSLTDAKYLKSLRFRSTLFSIGYCIFVIAIYSPFINDLLSDAFAAKYAPLKPTDGYYVPLQVVVLLFEFFYFSAWFLSLWLLYLVCVLLGREFDEVNKELEEVVRDRSLQQARLGMIRLRHVDACELLKRADLFLSPLIAITFVSSITSMCLMGYSIFIAQDYHYILRRIGLAVWAALSAFNLSMTCLFTAHVNTKVS